MLLAFLTFTFLSPSLSFASCPEGWMEADGCFKFLPEKTGLSWMGAIHACEQAGGYLAEPQTLLQMEALAEFAFINELEHGSLNWWIGTLDSGHEGRWTWHSSGQEVPTDFWGEGSPSYVEGNNLDCAIMQLIGTRLVWVDVSCETALHGDLVKKPSATAPVCQHKIQPTTTTTTSTTTTTAAETTTPWSTDCTKICKGLDDGFYSDPEHCCESSYCFCINGRGSLAHCDDWEMAWCDTYSSCIPKDECLASSAGCCPSATPNTITTTPKTKDSNPVDCTALCADHENGVFSDHSCCSDSYCFCIGGQGSRGYCEGNTTFCEYYSACIDGDDCLASLEGCCPYDPPPTPDPHPDDCNTFCYNQDDGEYSESCCSETYCTCNHGHGSHSQCSGENMAFCDSVKSCISKRECDNSNEVCCQ